MRLCRFGRAFLIRRDRRPGDELMQPSVLESLLARMSVTRPARTGARLASLPSEAGRA